MKNNYVDKLNISECLLWADNPFEKEMLFDVNTLKATLRYCKRYARFARHKVRTTVKTKESWKVIVQIYKVRISNLRYVLKKEVK